LRNMPIIANMMETTFINLILHEVKSNE